MGETPALPCHADRMSALLCAPLRSFQKKWGDHVIVIAPWLAYVTGRTALESEGKSRLECTVTALVLNQADGAGAGDTESRRVD